MMQILAALLLLLTARPLDGAGQLVVVRAPRWDARAGTLRRYVRLERGWVAVGPAVPAQLGDKGLAWGRGVAPVDPAAPPVEGPAKREGDGKTPVGVFRLGAATGAAAAPPEGARLAYQQADERLVCVDDPASRSYNSVTVRGDHDDWKSAESMVDPPVYDLTVFVEHNPGKVAGGGSCIFLHVLRRKGGTTAGCTAMDRPALEALVAWLDPGAKPLLVVLPDDAYVALRRPWGLP